MLLLCTKITLKVGDFFVLIVCCTTIDMFALCIIVSHDLNSCNSACKYIFFLANSNMVTYLIFRLKSLVSISDKV